MKRKNIIISSLALMLSIALMVFGVYSASAASLSVTGQVSYTVTDAKILVQGKVNGANGNTTEVGYPDANLSAFTSSIPVLNSTTQYLDYTNGGSTNNADDDLRPWALGAMTFGETTEGITPITISLKLTNYSPYSVMATVSFDNSDDEASAANVTRTTTGLTNNAINLAANTGTAASQEITITYALSSDSVSVNAFNIGMKITFAKTEPELAANSVAAISKNNGMIYMGETSDGEPIEWRCFAYSADGINWNKYTAGETVLTTENAQYCYFILNTYVSSMSGQPFLSESKTSYNSTDNLNYHVDLGDEVKVLSNDYYYSDIRSFINTNTETNLNIDKNSDIYKAIIPRTVADLYVNNIFTDWSSTEYKWTTITGTAEDLPTGANANDADTFWLLSVYELQEYFNRSTSENSSIDRQWLNGTSGVWVWSRSARADYSGRVGRVADNGGLYNLGVTLNSGARVAFKLQLQR